MYGAFRYPKRPWRNRFINAADLVALKADPLVDTEVAINWVTSSQNYLFATISYIYSQFPEPMVRFTNSICKNVNVKGQSALIVSISRRVK